MSPARLARTVGAVALLVGGAVHLQQWLRTYRDIDIGGTFLVNVALSIVVAVALFALDDRRSPILGMALAAGSLAALVLSRTAGFLGFVETGYQPAAVIALVAEALAVVALATSAALTTPPRTPAPQPA